MPYIERAITPILKERVSTSKCSLLVGARQVGKSTLIKHEFKNFNRVYADASGKYLSISIIFPSRVFSSNDFINLNKSSFGTS